MAAEGWRRLSDGEHGIAEEDRVTLNVAAAKVEEPAELIERTQHQRAAPRRKHLRTDARKLVGDALAREVERVRLERRARERRLLGPYGVHEILVHLVGARMRVEGRARASVEGRARVEVEVRAK